MYQTHPGIRKTRRLRQPLSRSQSYRKTKGSHVSCPLADLTSIVGHTTDDFSHGGLKPMVRHISLPLFIPAARSESSRAPNHIGNHIGYQVAASNGAFPCNQYYQVHVTVAACRPFGGYLCPGSFRLARLLFSSVKNPWSIVGSFLFFLPVFSPRWMRLARVLYPMA